MANVTVTIPDDKLEILVDLYQKRYGLQDTLSTSKAKTDFLGKVLSHETVAIVRQAIIETAQIQAQAAIKADNSIKKTEFETELEAKASALSSVIDEPK